MKATIIAVVGTKKSGKTATIEALTQELAKRGYKVAAIKHISEPNFTIDTEGKDTWRYARSGAKTIISVSTDEIATIEKTETENPSLDMILQKCGNNDTIFLEGFKKTVAKDKNISKIAVVKSAEEALQAVKDLEPMLAFTGPYSTENLSLSQPYIDILKHPEKIASIIEKNVKKSR